MGRVAPQDGVRMSKLPVVSVPLLPEEVSAPFFELSESDKEHPFTMVPNELIRNPDIDPETKWFISYLLSHVDRWRLYAPAIMKSQKLSKHTMYKLIDKAILSGYLSRTYYLESGKKRFKYFVSRTARFKKSLLFHEKQDTAPQDTVKRDRKEYQSQEKQEEKKTTTSPTPSKGKDVAAASSIQKRVIGDLEKSKLTVEQKERAVAFYVENKETCHAPAVKNPVGFVIDAIKNNRDVEVAGKKVIALKRLQWAKEHEWVAPAGNATAMHDAYYIHKGQHRECYPYDVDCDFWIEKGL